MRKIFDVVVKKGKAFSIVLTGITLAETLRFFTRNNIRIVTTFKERMRGFSNIKTGKIRLTIQSKIISKLSSTIRSGYTRIYTSIREKLQANVNIYVGVYIYTIAEERLRGTAKVNLNINVLAKPTVGLFKRLLDHDNSTMLSLDTSDMSILDYTAS